MSKKMLFGVKNKKGFTLVELLVSIVILGILTAVALPSIQKLMKDNEKTKYKTYEANLETSAKLYTDSYTEDMFGTDSSGCFDVDYELLEAKNLVKDIKIKGDSCKDLLTYVRVIKSNGTYNYETSIRCVNESGAEVYSHTLPDDGRVCNGKTPDEAPPTISISPNISGWIKDTTTKLKVEVADDYYLSNNQKVKYAWAKKGTNPEESAYKEIDYNNPKNTKAVVRSVPLPTATEGEYVLHVKPVRVVDLNGNAAYNEVLSGSYKIDTVPPVCEVNKSGTKGSDNWFLSNVTLTLNKSDTGSGVAAYGLTTSKTVTYNNKATDTQGGTAGTTWYGYVKDNAGNEGSCNSGTVKVDNNKLTCSVNLSGTKGSNGWYKSNVTVSLKSSGGVTSYGLTTSKTATYNNKNSVSQGNTSGVTYYGYVKDASGNVGKCNSANFKIDSTKPSCSIDLSGTKGSNGWYKSDIKLSLNKSDNSGGSGLDGYGLTTSSNATYNSKTSGTQGETKGTTWYGYVKDKAGNTNSCNQSASSVKTDKSKPKLTYNLTKEGGGSYKSGDTSDKNVVRNLIASDGTSGIDHIEWYNSSKKKWSTESHVSNYTFKTDTSLVNDTKYRAVDKAGITSDEVHIVIKILKDVDKNFKIGCKQTCAYNDCGIKVNGKMYWNDKVWKWDFKGAGSGIKKSTATLKYSTEWVKNYCNYTPKNAPNGDRSSCGKVIFSDSQIVYCRSYARSSIVGRVCTNGGKCTECKITEK